VQRSQRYLEHSSVTGFAILEMSVMLLISLPVLLGGIALAKYFLLSSEICAVAELGANELEREPVALLRSGVIGIREPERISKYVSELLEESISKTGMNTNDLHIEACLWVMQNGQVGQGICQHSGMLQTKEFFSGGVLPREIDASSREGADAIVGSDVSARTHLEFFGFERVIECKRIRAARNEVVL